MSELAKICRTIWTNQMGANLSEFQYIDLELTAPKTWTVSWLKDWLVCICSIDRSRISDGVQHRPAQRPHDHRYPAAKTWPMSIPYIANQSETITSWPGWRDVVATNFFRLLDATTNSFPGWRIVMGVALPRGIYNPSHRVCTIQSS
jgi:hypothetical protein